VLKLFLMDSALTQLLLGLSGPVISYDWLSCVGVEGGSMREQHGTQQLSTAEIHPAGSLAR
jgi:hypothetical protein